MCSCWFVRDKKVLLTHFDSPLEPGCNAPVLGQVCPSFRKLNNNILCRVHRSSWWSNRSDHRSSMMIMIDHQFDHRSFLIINDHNDHKWLPLSTPSITKCVPCVLVSCVSPASCSINSFVLNNYRDRDGSVTIDSRQLIGHRQQTYGKFTNLPSYDDRLMIDDHS